MLTGAVKVKTIRVGGRRAYSLIVPVKAGHASLGLVTAENRPEALNVNSQWADYKAQQIEINPALVGRE